MKRIIIGFVAVGLLAAGCSSGEDLSGLSEKDREVVAALNDAGMGGSVEDQLKLGRRMCTAMDPVSKGGSGLSWSENVAIMTRAGAKSSGAASLSLRTITSNYCIRNYPG